MGKKRDDYHNHHHRHRHHEEDVSHTMLGDRKAAMALASVGLLETILAGTWRHDVGIAVGCACLVLALFRLLISVPDFAGRLRRAVLGGGVKSSGGSSRYAAEMLEASSSSSSSAPLDVEAASRGDGAEPPNNTTTSNSSSNNSVHSAMGERAQLVLPMEEQGGGGSGGRAIDGRATVSCDTHRMMNSPVRRRILSALSVILGGFALALAAVHLASPDPRMATFPARCEVG